jgi:histidinol-phosphate aminotransferase
METITDRTKLIIVASPNNPTGAVVNRDHLLAIAAAARQAVLMVDEAYYHFHGESSMKDLATVPNLIVARTFSKAYGLASLRVGMLAGNAELLKYVRKVSSPYNVNGVALECLPAAVADEEYLAWYSEQVRTGRERMMNGLREFGVPFFPSHANFVLMNIGPKHKALVDAMRAHGVLLRDRSTDPGCDGFVRITIGLEEHVTRGLDALKASLREIGWSVTA